AAANEAVYLVRTSANRPDIPVISSWIPHILYSHLVLADYLGRSLPWNAMISSEDGNRRRWAADPACFDQGCFLPNQPEPSPESRRWPYSASFIMGPAFFDESIVGYRIQSAGNTSYYQTFG